MRSQPIGRLGVAALGAVVAGAAFSSARGEVAPTAATPVDFARDVQPILAASCVRCHAAGLAQGQLRLDTREGLLKGGASGPVVVPGNGQGSLLYQRLVLDDPQKRMPWLSDPLLAAADRDRAPVDRRRGTLAGGPDRRPAPRPRPRRPPSCRRLPRPRASDGPGSTFNRDVRPILADNCYACHGPDRNNRQAGLRLDREDVAKAALASGHVAIVPGAPEKSALIERDHRPGRAEAHAARLERQGTPEPRPDRHAAALDRAGGAVGAALVLHRTRAAAAARGEGRGLAKEPGRCLRPRRDREAGALASAEADRASCSAG